jgi:hypothetical protein
MVGRERRQGLREKRYGVLILRRTTSALICINHGLLSQVTGNHPLLWQNDAPKQE